MKNRFLKIKAIKKLERIRKKKAGISKMERAAVKNFYHDTDSDLIHSVCKKVKENGHPGEITVIETIYGHYLADQLTAEEILNFIDIYDSTLETEKQRHESKE